MTSEPLIEPGSKIVNGEALLGLADFAYRNARTSADKSLVIKACERLKLSKSHAPNFTDHEFEFHAFRRRS